MRRYPELTFTKEVQAAQERYGVRQQMDRFAELPGDDIHLSERETSFIAERDGFYMASVTSDGWPYVQFRGGPKGFLKVLGPQTLAFADFRGNRQYISTGNIDGSGRVALMLMDYPNRQRMKVLAQARVVELGDDPGLIERLTDVDYNARIERAVVLDVEAFDWNCPQHIVPRFSVDELIERFPGIRDALDVP